MGEGNHSSNGVSRLMSYITMAKEMHFMRQQLLATETVKSTSPYRTKASFMNLVPSSRLANQLVLFHEEVSPHPSYNQKDFLECYPRTILKVRRVLCGWQGSV